MNDWRDDPATKPQKQLLKSLGLKYSRSVTKGEVSDLIASTEKPIDEQVEILKFLKISGISAMSQLDAGRKIEELFADPEVKRRWEGRGASKEQKEIFRFFEMPVPSGLQFSDAENRISELFDDESKEEAWQSHFDVIEDREMWFEDTREGLNFDNDHYDCKKVGKKVFKEAVVALESAGMTLDQIESNEPAIWAKILELHPEQRRASAASTRAARSSSSKEQLEKPKRKTSLVLKVALVLLFLAFLQAFYSVVIS